jgi:hypothetical protein
MRTKKREHRNEQKSRGHRNEPNGNVEIETERREALDATEKLINALERAAGKHDRSKSEENEKNEENDKRRQNEGSRKDDCEMDGTRTVANDSKTMSERRHRTSMSRRRGNGKSLSKLKES